VKVEASLFAFIPAIGYLLGAPTVHAMSACDNDDFITCTYYETVCENYDCGTYNTWYTVNECYDVRYGRTEEGVCYYEFINTHQEC
jgi:hypothetical protein